MSPAAWWTAGAVGLLLAAPLGVHGLAYARAAAWKRRARTACPFEDDDHDTLTATHALQLVAAESALWGWAMLTAMSPPAETAPSAPAGVPVVVLTPPGLPRASVRALVTRLRRDGFRVVCPPARCWARSLDDRIATFDRTLRTVWEQTGVRRIDVIAPAGAASVVATHLARGGSGVPSVRRLLTVGARGDHGPPVPPSTEVIAFYSYDDPFLGPLDGVRRPGAVNVAVRALGRLGLLHAPHVYTLLHEHLPALAPERSESWTSATS